MNKIRIFATQKSSTIAAIHIKNVGPLKDTGEITLNKLSLIIGKQSFFESEHKDTTIF